MMDLFLFRDLPDPAQLVPPVALKGSRPLVQGAQGVRLCTVEPVAAAAPGSDQAGVTQHAQVFRNGRLWQSEPCRDVADGLLSQRQVTQDLAASRFCYGVEDIGCGSGSGHVSKIHSDMGICQIRLSPTCCGIACLIEKQARGARPEGRS
jgi:hypothetical protein